jgi:two-component system, sporulation sensor kinase A
VSRSFPIFGDRIDATIEPDDLVDLFLNCTPDGFAILDMENRFIRINPMYTEIFGYTEEDIIGRSFIDFPNPDSVIAIIDSVKKGQVYSDLVSKRIHKDGTVLDIAVSYSPLRNSTGEIIAVMALYRDITYHKNMERELKKTRELYRLITENTTDMIKVFSKDFTIIYASPSCWTIMGERPEDLIGRKLTDFILPEEKDVYRKKFQALLESGEPQLVQKKLITSDNQIMYAEYNVSPIYNDQKEIDSFVIVGRNITDRVKNDTVLRNLDRLSIIGQLAAGVAHEIRNPLTSLKGFSKLLQNSAPNGKQEHYLSIIMDELDRIDVIVNEFMSLAKPQAIMFEKENIYSIIQSTVNILHPQAMLNNVQISISNEGQEIEVLCSSNQLKQVFVNFLKNAIEAMPNGGKVEIQIQKIEDKKVKISFIDEGIGIGENLIQYLGTPFYTTKEKGIGLGLTVSNKIIQEHSGTMDIKSKIGKGTTITVELECL